MDPRVREDDGFKTGCQLQDVAQDGVDNARCLKRLTSCLKTMPLKKTSAAAWGVDLQRLIASTAASLKQFHQHRAAIV